MELGKYNQALELAQKIVDQTPGDPHAKLLLGRLRAQNNQPDVSKQIFSELLAELTLVPPEIMRGNNDLQFVNAFASYLNKDYENAVKALESYLLTHSNNNNTRTHKIRATQQSRPVKSLLTQHKKSTVISINTNCRLRYKLARQQFMR